MDVARLRVANGRQPRLWLFASCVFDEANWTLIVDSRRVSLETKPLEILRELLLRAGSVVPKEELRDLIWPNVTVVDASLPTAIHKLRVALGENDRGRSIIETIPGIGYRLAVPVEVRDRNGLPQTADSTEKPQDTGGGQKMRSRLGFAAAIAMTAIVSATLTIAIMSSRDSGRSTQIPGSRQDIANALRRLDVATIETQLAAGWNPNSQFDGDGNSALNYLLNICEWNPRHDQQRMLLVARTLIDGGTRLDQRNIWGDTPYSIAKADRYCGPNHPVTQMLRTHCYAGLLPLGDRCLASYELARRPSRSTPAAPKL